jgi:hypothetical protein
MLNNNMIEKLHAYISENKESLKEMTQYSTEFTFFVSELKKTVHKNISNKKFLTDSNIKAMRNIIYTKASEYMLIGQSGDLDYMFGTILAVMTYDVFRDEKQDAKDRETKDRYQRIFNIRLKEIQASEKLYFLTKVFEKECIYFIENNMDLRVFINNEYIFLKDIKRVKTVMTIERYTKDSTFEHLVISKESLSNRELNNTKILGPRKNALIASKKIVAKLLPYGEIKGDVEIKHILPLATNNELIILK